jgi:hypothetical protein
MSTLCFCNTVLLLLLLFTAIGFSPGGSSPYTSTHNTNGNIIYIKVTIQNKLLDNAHSFFIVIYNVKGGVSKTQIATAVQVSEKITTINHPFSLQSLKT